MMHAIQHGNRSWATARHKGIELGPVGFMPEDPQVLGPALADHGLELIGGVVFRPFHDPSAWNDVLDGAHRTCAALKAHGACHFVLIDSISPDREYRGKNWPGWIRIDSGDTPARRWLYGFRTGSRATAKGCGQRLIKNLHRHRSLHLRRFWSCGVYAASQGAYYLCAF